MSPSGQSRPKSDVRLTSGLLLITTEQRTSHEVGSGPQADIKRCGRRYHGGAVLCIEESSHMERIQAASCGRPVHQSAQL
jgi:hypothetical protein